MLTVENYK